jgi:hypothetical protein
MPETDPRLINVNSNIVNVGAAEVGCRGSREEEERGRRGGTTGHITDGRDLCCWVGGGLHRPMGGGEPHF